MDDQSTTTNTAFAYDSKPPHKVSSIDDVPICSEPYGQSPETPKQSHEQQSPHLPFVAPLTPLPVDEKVAQQLQNFVFIGSYGKIRGVEILTDTGTDKAGAVRTVWFDELKGIGYHMVHLHLNSSRGQLFALTYGNLFCFEALTGKIIWHVKPVGKLLTECDLTTLLCTHDSSLLISAASGSVAAFDSSNGQCVWQHIFETGGDFGSYALLEHRGTLFVGNRGIVYAIQIASGAFMWKCSLVSGGPVSLASYITTPNGSSSADILFAGTNGYVLSIDAKAGTIRHQINLEGTGYKPVALLFDPVSEALITATSGEMRSFKGDSMELMWKSDLPGMSYSFQHSLLFSNDHILVGMAGNLAAVNRRTGAFVWKSSLPVIGGHKVTVASLPHPTMILCGTKGTLVGVNKTDGKVLWEDGLKGMGYQSLCISTVTFNTDFNSTTIPQATENSRQVKQSSHGISGFIFYAVAGQNATFLPNGE